jgi:hypothetical protein
MLTNTPPRFYVGQENCSVFVTLFASRFAFMWGVYDRNEYRPGEKLEPIAYCHSGFEAQKIAAIMNKLQEIRYWG